MRSRELIAVVAFAAVACKVPQELTTPAPVKLSGAVEKGPFVLGSSVSISPVDAAGNPTGQVFKTQTTNDLGQFRVDFTYQGFVSLEGVGFYYNEVAGKLSTSLLTLRAFYEVTTGGAQDAYINIVTHLTYDRVKRLLADGTAVPAAVGQAEAELRTALGIGAAGFDPGARGTEMNILGGDTSANAYLFAVSTVLAEAARVKAGPEGSVDATLQELINTLALDFSDDGKIAPSFSNALKEAQKTLDPEQVTDLLRRRLDDLGSPAEVPDLHRALDGDLDGVPNAADTCPLQPNPDQTQVQGVCSFRKKDYGVDESGWLPLVALSADFDGDGDLDVIAGSQSGRAGEGAGPGLHLFPGDGSGSLGTASTIALGDLSYTPGVALAGDVDRDGHPDLVLNLWKFGPSPSPCAEHCTFWLKGDGGGGFGVPDAILKEPYAVVADFHLNGFRRAVMADFDGDGRNDFLGSYGNGDRVAIVFGLEGGGWGRPAQVALPTNIEVTGVATADLNEDSKADVIVTSADYIPEKVGGLFVLLGDGAGGFTISSAITSAGTRLNGVAVGDVDGDGDLDAMTTAVSGEATGKVAVLFGDGKGALGGAALTGLTGGVGGTVYADFTGDGKDDVAVFAHEAGLYVLSSQGRTFSAPVKLKKDCAPMGASDLNGDGRSDLFARCGALSVFLINP